MTANPVFELWLEFEHWEPKPEDDATDDFFNMQVRLPDGQFYAFNVWTFKFLQRARYSEVSGEMQEYVLPPDLFVEELNRALLERVVTRMLAQGEMKSEWLYAPDEEAS